MKILKTLIIVFIFFSSCNLKKETLDYINLKNTYCKVDEYCALGIGKTFDEAKNNAKEELAEQIYSFVISEFERNIEIQNGKFKEYKKSFIKTFTNIPLVNIKPYKIGKISNKYYYVIKIPKEKAKKIYNEYKNTFTAISYISKLESLSDLSLRISLLKDIYKEIKIKKIGDKLFYSPKLGKVVSFNSYVKIQLQEILSLLKVILVPKGIVLVSKKDLSPVKNVKLIVITSNRKKITGTTDYKGFLKLIDKDFLLDVYLDFPAYKKELLIGRLYKKETPISDVYIYTFPLKLNFEIYKNQTLIKQGLTPDIVEVQLDKYTTYKIHIFGKDYENIEETLGLKSGYDYYFYKKLRKLRFGYIDIKVKGDGILFIQSADGRTIVSYRENKNNFKGKLPVGKYNIMIRNSENPSEFQTVVDTIFIKENSKVKRIYFEPKDRGFYKKGHGLGLFFTSVSGDLPIEYQCQDGFLTTCDNNFDLNLVGFFYKRFWYNYWGGLRIGLTSLSKSTSSYSGDSSSGIFYDFGAGVVFGEKVIFELGAGYLQAYGKYSAYNESAKVKIQSPYLSFKISLSGLGIELKKTLGKNDLIFFTFDLGGYSFKKGYKRPKIRKAVNGLDYKEFFK